MKNKLISTLVTLLFVAAHGAFAQGTAFTYQGRVTDNGTNFNGTGQFQFALVTSTNGQQATATATMGGLSPNEFVGRINVSAEGSGYAAAPAVNISGGGGSGATAQANISGGLVTSITVLTPGSNYSSAPIVMVAPPAPDYTTWWSNDGTSVNGSEPSAAVSVSVSQGLFTVAPGNTTLSNMTAIPAGIFSAETNLQLLIWFNDGVNGFAMLNPPQSLTPAPYAVFAETANAAQLSGTLNLSTPEITYGGGVVLYASDYYNNFFVGFSAGDSAADYGLDNVAVGESALRNNDSGDYNTAIGTAALFENTNGSDNTAVGVVALVHNTTGNYNTADGMDSLYNNVSGSGNTASGWSALNYNNGNYNTAIGFDALPSLGSGGVGGNTNTALGYLAGSAFTNQESGNIDIGNIGVGGESGIIRIGTPGTQSATYLAGTIYGNGGGLTNLNASQLTSGVLNLSTPEITSGGTVILYASPSSYGNFFVGPAAGNSSEDIGSDNFGVGASALYNNIYGYYNTAVGFEALYSNTNGGENTAIGLDALYSNTSGYYNTADGMDSLFENQSGYGNTASGFQSLYWDNGNYNTAIGNNALEFLGTDGIAGNNNTALGYDAGSAFNHQESGNIDIGNNGIAGDNNITRIGTPGTQTATYLAGSCSCLGYQCQQGTGGTPSGHLFNFYWTGTQFQAWVDTTEVGVVSLTSDRRLKEDIQPMAGDALARVMALKPSTFKYKSIPKTIFQGDGQTHQEGFIADELQQVIPSAVNGRKDAVTPAGTIQPQTINLMPLVAVLTKAVQEQQEEINDLKAQVKALSRNEQ